ncbi:hypothetical protein [Quatrionicoccus australiensis]|uniref:hypothetical protein n=1 Tax=Quatrionicoccus australiensis TaxID=138118 RepID=UPI001CF7F548|nr:hypothetical protein [Quatrionicoccus australiensis]UCV13767.1 hypothetical protein KI612_12460 [Quatrionicoccus australiensis]
MIYDHTITMTVSIEQLETAKRISRALDPDVGGYEAFQQRNEDGTKARYSTPCTADFARNAAMLLMIPSELHAVVAADYAARWSDLPVPTLDDVTAFCANVECYVDDAAQSDCI